MKLQCIILCWILCIGLVAGKTLDRKVRRGVCPKPQGPGICVEQCSSNTDCRSRNPDQLCCFNGCGHVCMNPVRPVNVCADHICRAGQKCIPEPKQCITTPCYQYRCEGSMCPKGEPLKDENGQEVFCGRGPGRQECPDTHHCNIDPADQFAVCCPNTISDVDKCSQPKDPGPCEAIVPKWYFNTTSQTCKKFTYGGCQGNDNRFDSLSLCNKECTHVDKCSLPKDPGPCKGSFPRWYYDTASTACLRFTYGGCQGNNNRFDSLKACKKECIHTRPDKRRSII